MKTQSCVRMLSVNKAGAFAKDVVFHPYQNLALVALGAKTDDSGADSEGLASVATCMGEIQLWDFELGVLVERFREHTAIVRCLDFHPTQPMFASADDKGNFVLWDYQKKQVVFRKQIINDYIRGVHFHSELPWVALACDDNCVRILNWQSREIIYVLEAHTDYVMSARFHPKLDLLVTASLDKTAKIWDFSGLRKYGSKGVSKALMTMQSIGRAAVSTVNTIVNKTRRRAEDSPGFSSLINASKSFKPVLSSNALERDGSSSSSSSSPSITGMRSSGSGHGGETKSSVVAQRLSHLVSVISDQPICLIAVLDHPDLVDWAEFSPHHTTLVATGCDDNSVRLWNVAGAVPGMSPQEAASKGAAEFAVLNGHTRSLVRVRFHPAIPDALFSCSEDGTARVWSLTKAFASASGSEAAVSGAGVTADAVLVSCGPGHVVWSVGCHGSRPLIGIAHASGFGVLRLKREVYPVATDAMFTMLPHGVEAPMAARMYSLLPVNGHVCFTLALTAAPAKPLFAQATEETPEVSAGADIPYTQLMPYFSLGERAEEPSTILFNNLSTATCPSFADTDKQLAESGVSSFLVVYPSSKFELITLPGHDIQRMAARSGDDCDSAAFVSSSRFVTLSLETGELAVRSFANEVKRIIPIIDIIANAIASFGSPDSIKSASEIAANLSVSSLRSECPPAVFAAGPGRVIIVAGDHIVLYDVHAYRPISYCKLSTYAPPPRVSLIRTHAESSDEDEIEVLGQNGEVNADLALYSTELVARTEGTARRVVSSALWCPGQAFVAFQLGYGVFVLDRNLSNPARDSLTIQDSKACASHSTPIISMIWAKVGPTLQDYVLLYTTRTHLHYLVPTSGEIGVVRTFGQPVTLLSAHPAPNFSTLSVLYIPRYPTENAQQEDVTTPQMQVPIRALTFNASELLVKAYTQAGRSDSVTKVLASGHLFGKAILNFLRCSNSPELAIMFVNDPVLKFNFALEAGDLAVAQQCAEQLNQTPVWAALAERMLMYGHFEGAAACFARAGDFNRLAFLYLVMGRRDLLRTLSLGSIVANQAPEALVNEFERRGYQSYDLYRYSLLNGDLPVTLAMLHKAAKAYPFTPSADGTPPAHSQSHLDKLAMVSASIHGLSRLGKFLKREVQKRDGSVPSPATLAALFATTGGGAPTLNMPRPPVSAVFASPLSAQDVMASGTADPLEIESAARVPTWLVSGQWPERADVLARASQRKAQMENQIRQVEELQMQSRRQAQGTDDPFVGETQPVASQWDLAADFVFEDQAPETKPPEKAEGTADGWGIEGGFDFEGLSDVEPEAEAKVAGNQHGDDALGLATFSMPTKGQSLLEKWSNTLTLVGDVVATGQFDQAMHLLRTQIGAVNFAPLKPYMLAQAGIASHAVLATIPGLHGLALPLIQPTSDASQTLVPMRMSIARVRQLVKEMVDYMTAGAFEKTTTTARAILAVSPLLVVDTQQEVAEVQEAIALAREYILAVKIETARAAVAQAAAAGGAGAQSPKSATLDQANLAALATLCSVKPTHKIILLWLACKHCFGMKAYATVAKFCTALLTIASQENIDELKGKIDLEMVKKILRKCQMEQTDQVKLAFDPNDSVAICATRLVPMPWSRALEGREVLACPYCGAKHSAAGAAASPICSLCTISELNAAATGLKISHHA